MKVLVSDNLGDAGIQILKEEEGIEVDVNTGLEPEKLRSIIGGYDGLIIRSATKVTGDLLDAAENLKVVGRAGIGLDNVDIPEATKRGVAVMNTPGGNVVTTAEHAISLMMSLTRNIPQGTSSLRDGRWDKKRLQGREVFNKVLGVIGYGNIGSIVANRARGLKMNVIVYDPIVTPEKIDSDGYESVTLEELYRRSDYITVHVPKLKSTIGLLNKDAFDQMKDGVMIINCARGGIVDEGDIYDAIKSGKVGGAALDVFETEPPGESPLFELDNVICTPHLGASTREAQTNVAVAVAQQIIEYLKNDTVINAVNVPSVTGDLLAKLEPFLTLADGIGSLQAQLSSGPIREVVLEYSGDFQGLDLSPVTTAVLKGLLRKLGKDEVNSVNAPVFASDMGIKVTETSMAESANYTNLISAKVITTDMVTTIAGTIFGKNEPRVVQINKFHLEMIIEKGFFAIIHNLDKPGAIGSIGSTLGNNNINIARMHVGQEEDGDRNIIFLQTDVPMSDTMVQQLSDLSMVKSVIPLII